MIKMNKVKMFDGGEVNIKCGIESVRTDFETETVLISVPISEDKLFCFPSFIQGLKRLIDNTSAKCTVAFAVNSEDVEIISAIRSCDIDHIIIPAVRNGFCDEGLYWVHCITLAREALREWAIIHGYDWMFFLDADTCIDAGAINRLLSYDFDASTAFYWQRVFLEWKDMGDPPGFQIYISRGPDKSHYVLGVGYEEAKKQPSPIWNADTSFGACLISRKAFSSIAFYYGYIPLEPYESINDLGCSELGRFLSEDMHFGYDAAVNGMNTSINVDIKTLHFLFEDDYPRGYAETGELVTYEEYMGR